MYKRTDLLKAFLCTSKCKILVHFCFFYNIHQPMKTLIENLTSDLLPNQIFQTGFSFLIILKRELLTEVG